MVRLIQALAGGREGGAELYFLRFCLALRRAGVAQRVILRPHPRFLAELRAGGIDPVTAPFGGPLDLKTGWIFRREIAAFRPEVVLTYMSRASHHCPKGDFIHLGRLGGYYNLKYFRRCDHLVCNAPDIVEYCVDQGFAPARVHLVPNFVEDRRAQPCHRRVFDTPDDAALIFALGRLHPNKAFDTLLHALAELPGVHLWLAGDGPLRGALEKLARDLGLADRVRFLGWQDDPAPFFAAADVQVVPSRHEPLGNVVLEGWMQRLPLVAAASQGPRFLVRDGENGLLVPIDDSAAMAIAIGRVLKDPALAARLAENGRRAFESGYTEAVAVARYLALFERLLSDRAATPAA